MRIGLFILNMHTIKMKADVFYDCRGDVVDATGKHSPLVASDKLILIFLPKLTETSTGQDFLSCPSSRAPVLQDRTGRASGQIQ
jgi:hypothetical protein